MFGCLTEIKHDNKVSETLNYSVKTEDGVQILDIRDFTDRPLKIVAYKVEDNKSYEDIKVFLGEELVFEESQEQSLNVDPSNIKWINQELIKYLLILEINAFDNNEYVILRFGKNQLLGSYKTYAYDFDDIIMME